MPSLNNSEWISALRQQGETRERAVAELREILVRGLRHGLSTWLEPHTPSLESLTQETAQEAVLRILAQLDKFEGRSRFTTWAHKVAIRIALTELRHKEWKNVSLDQMLEPEGGESRELWLADTAPGPELTVEQNDLLARLSQLMKEELTPRQMNLMQAVALRGVPLEALAQKMNVERNALYKLMHDARLKLKRRLA
ncbi:MAG: sigma-70 family RNA polymerase sigma factor, partial [Anaerolineales bacterium]